MVQVLAAWTILPFPCSPTFQLWDIFAIYCHFRCALHLEAWYIPAWHAQDTALPPVSPLEPAIRLLNWLRLPQGRALLATLVAVAPVPRRGPIWLDTLAVVQFCGANPCIALSPFVHPRVTAKSLLAQRSFTGNNQVV